MGPGLDFFLGSAEMHWHTAFAGFLMYPLPLLWPENQAA